MDNEKLNDKVEVKPKKSRLNKILSIPGIEDAIATVQDYALEKAVFRTIDEGARGEFGDELKAMLESDNKDSTTLFLEQEEIENAIWDSHEEILLGIAALAGSKIAELWGLSESAGKLISLVVFEDEIEWGKRIEDLHTRHIILVSTEDVGDYREFPERSKEIIKQGFIVRASDRIPKGRIFLDVTQATNDRLHSAYKAIEMCRRILKIKHDDLRAGAPKSFDTDKAFEVDQLVKTGKSNVSIAKQLGFRIYKDYYNKDTPSRSFFKYKKLGKEIAKKLESLECYLSDI